MTASGTISPADLAPLADGAHSLIVRGRDAAGNWGPTSSSSLVLDRAGPTTSSVTGSPDPTQGSATVTLSAQVTDPSSVVAAAEWFIGADPGAGRGTPMTAADGAFDGPGEVATGSMSLAGRPFGELVVSVRGRDEAGNWGTASVGAVSITPSDGIFADGFETGTADRWSAKTGANRMTVSSAAATAGRWGLAITVQSATKAYITDTSPIAATAYSARFTLDARGLSTAGAAVDVFTALDKKNATIVQIQYQGTSSGAGQIRAGTRRAGGTTYTSWLSLPAGAHVLEVGWSAGSSTTLTLKVDGAAAASASGLDTRAYALETVRLGPSAGLTKSMTGGLWFDRFVSSRGSSIGP